MARGRNLIVLSDGTGNSASAVFKTNVWRLYQALDLTDGTQLAVFGDGVGNSSIKFFRILGLAFGIGIKRNVLNLYKFLCRNYQDGDKIYAFGFSRGAFTIRVLVGLINRIGLVSYGTEAELDRNALAAYRDYRKHAFKLRPWLVWVRVLRFLRDSFVWMWNEIADRRQFSEVEKIQVRIHFVGVWDTVAAYGLPIVELTQAVNKWVWPLTFAQRNLPESVDNARHALSLDDERTTFFPTLWDERWENDLVCKGKVSPGRLKQVWFAGSHADVGGGYPDDGLSFMSLGWMIGEAAAKELRFVPSIVETFAGLATPTGRIYDSRAGLGAFYRYQPRDAQELLDRTDLASPPGASITPVVYSSVITRIVSGTEGYAPISLPMNIEVLPPYGPPIGFDKSKVQQALAVTNPGGTALSVNNLKKYRAALNDTLTAVTNANIVPLRPQRFELARDTVWWRRVNYFVSLILVFIAVAFPLLAAYLRLPGVIDQSEVAVGGTVLWLAETFGGFLPSFVAPWTNAIARRPVIAVAVLAALLLSLRWSAHLQQQIWDRARAAWVAEPKKNRLMPTGQRGALFEAVLWLGAFAIVALIGKSNPRWALSFASGAAIFAAWWGVRRYLRPTESVDPVKPGVLLKIARIFRTAPWSKTTYRVSAEYVFPALFLAISGAAILSMLHRGAFDVASASGRYCMSTMPDLGGEVLVESSFETKNMCQPMGIRLIEGRKYRIQIDMGKGDGEWFDKGIRTDVEGFGVAGLQDWRHITASPLKRWWFENWFQPIARIGKIGNYEHVLRPAAPLTVIDRLPECEFNAPGAKPCPSRLESDSQAAGAKNCPLPPSKRDWEADIPSPAGSEFKEWELACEAIHLIKANRTLRADITADATGELFIYVNDAVLAIPGLENLFYENNGGKAKLTVTRIFADEIIKASAE